MSKKKYRLFVDGAAGTTGLQIQSRLAQHPYLELVTIDPKFRKDLVAKRDIMASVDLVVLCLPDAAAKQVVSEIGDHFAGPILDTSTAYRCDANWVYGLPEMAAEQRHKIAQAKRVSNPGCYATGAVILLRPLILSKLISATNPYVIHAVSGYSGGGKQLITKYESDQSTSSSAYALYGLDFNHKHIPEIQCYSELIQVPVFLPSVISCYQGMFIQIVLMPEQLLVSDGEEVYKTLHDCYQNEPYINVKPLNQIDQKTQPYLTPDDIAGRNRVDVYVFSDSKTGATLLLARLDNLGKGASGAAMQNINIMLGVEESLAVEL